MAASLDPIIAELLKALPRDDWRSLSPQSYRALLASFKAISPDTNLPVPAAIESLSLDTPVGPIGARLYRPAAAGPTPTVVYFHGGGWVGGDLDTHDGQCRTLSVETGSTVLSIDYRLAPEHPFPAAFDDSLAATRWAAANIDRLGRDAARLAVAGDSAGGNLAATVTQECRDRGPQIIAQLLVYPAVDLVGGYGSAEVLARHPSLTENANGYFLTLEGMQWFAQHYLPAGIDRADPRVSPLHAADLSRLPPAVVCTAGFDPLRDEGNAYARALQAAGGKVILREEPSQVHGFFGMGRFSPDAAGAIREALADFKSLL